MVESVETEFLSLNIEGLFRAIYRFFAGAEFEGGGLIAAWSIFEFIAALLIPILLVATVYCIIRIQQLRRQAHEKYEEEARGLLHVRERRNERWERIVKLAASENPGDWRVAVMDADAILDMLIGERFGLPEMTLGERLKRLGRRDLRTLDLAWDAHKVRNQIAHAGSDFILTQREARRVVECYRQVFEELGFL